MDESFWIMELEAALLDDCTVNDIYKICAGKVIPESVRPDVWQVCLDVRHKSDQLSQFNGIFDLPFQRQLRTDCNTVVEKLGNEDEDKVSVVSDLESILTFYCKKRKVRQYESQNGWNELLLPLLALKLPRCDTFNLFEAIRDTYIPKGCVRQGNVFHLFRLLLQYHDPELCSVLDTKRITTDQFSLCWFQTLFASSCSPAVIMSMWDIYFQQSDPFLIFFLALTMLINGREQVLSMRDDQKEKVIETLASMPCALEQEDVADFCSLAQYYNNKTPTSFKTDLLKILFGMTSDGSSGNIDEKRVDPSVAQALCLPVTVYELVDNTLTRQNPDGVKFFLVDCRPASQYNSGHLATAFHLDSGLMLQEPQAFATAIQGLLQAQKQAIQANSNAGGEHLCFMGSGRVDEDQYMHMVVASFLQKNTQYVSVLTGGYIAIHDYFGDHMRDCLEDHDAGRCLICQANARRKQMGQQQQGMAKQQQQTSASSKQNTNNMDIFAKISDTFKMKSAEVKDKLFDYIANPVSATSQSGDNQQLGAGQVQDRHVVAQDRSTGKRYRNVAPVFSIDDDQETNESFLPTSFSLEGIFSSATGGGGAKSPTTPTQPQEEFVQLPVFLKQHDILDYFKCQEVHMNGTMYDSYLAISNTHLIVVREFSGKRGKVIARRSLSSIVKISAKKRHRDLITFKYGNAGEENVVITDMDRFVIPNASEATTVISNHILKRHKEEEEGA